MRTIVVLPAPFGPSSAKIVPSSTVRLTSSSTTWSPKDLHTSRATIAGAACRRHRGSSLSVRGRRRGARPRRAAPPAAPSTPAPARAVCSTRKSANAAISSSTARRSGGASAQDARPSRASSPCSWYSVRSNPIARATTCRCGPGPSARPRPGIGGSSAERLQRVDRAGDGAAAGQQGVGQLADALLARVADRQVAEQPAHHRGQPVAAGVEPAHVVGESDLGVGWHGAHHTQFLR